MTIKNNKTKDKKLLSVQEYFDKVKSVKQTLTKENLEQMKKVATNLQKKALAMGQISQLEKKVLKIINIL